MGSGASFSSPDDVLNFQIDAAAASPEDIFAFQVVKGYYEQVKAIQASDDICMPEAEALNQILRNIHSQAKLEVDLPLEECTSPAVVAFKYKGLSQEEKDGFNGQVVGAILEKEAIRKRLLAKKPVDDYSQSFGGTAADTKNEKEAADLMRGGQKAAEEEPPLLKRPTSSNLFDGLILRKAGVWKKFLGAECYLFIHTLTRDVEGVRPSDYVEEEEGTKSDQVVEERDPANGLLSIELPDLPATIDRIVTETKKTPLILDPLGVGARSFFEYKGILEVCLTIKGI